MSKIVRVTKQFRFEMGHALMNYEGPCKNIHGHSYQLDVTLKGRVKQNPELNDNGMVLDFTVLKKIVKTHVIDVFDHALVLNNSMDFDKSAISFSEKLIMVEFQPTCENLILHFINLIRPNMPEELELYKVRLRETHTSYAEWYATDN